MPKFSPAKLGSAIAQRQKVLGGAVSATWQPWEFQPGPQQQAAETEAFETLFGGRAGGGKGQKVTTQITKHGLIPGQDPEMLNLTEEERLELEGKVLTPDGYLPMSHILYGTRVVNPDGAIARVIAIHDLGAKWFYRVQFSDGTSTEVTEDHLWAIATDTPPPLHSDHEDWNGWLAKHFYLVTTDELSMVMGICRIFMPMRRGQGRLREAVRVTRTCLDYGRCITVDHINGLYLTNDDIVTHNSAALLTLATTQHRDSIIFRRVYPNLKEMIMKSRQILRGSGASYNGTDKLWQGIPGDRTLEFGAIQHPDNVDNYRGRAHDLKAFDEVTEFLESVYEFPIGWTRTHIPGQRCRVIATCNPPSNREGLWVVKRWAPWVDPSYKWEKADPGELRWFARIPSLVMGQALTVDDIMPYIPEGSRVLRKVTHSSQYEIECRPGEFLFEPPIEGYEPEWIDPVSRTFIPATLADNKFIDAAYKRTLMAMPEPLRSQLLYGDFSLDVETATSEWQLIPLAWVRLAQQRWATSPPCTQSALGVDVARGGQDNTAIVMRHHTWIGQIDLHPGGSVPSSADSAHHARMAAASKNIPIHVDTVGVGAGTYDFLIEWGLNAYSVNAGAVATRMDRKRVLEFSNLRSQLLWNLREIFDPDYGFFPAIPPDDKELEEELTIPQWRRKRDKIEVESREELMKADRLGRSPDKLSGMMLAFSDFIDDYGV